MSYLPFRQKVIGPTPDDLSCSKRYEHDEYGNYIASSFEKSFVSSEFNGTSHLMFLAIVLIVDHPFTTKGC